jgi:hypothetical protein
MLGVIRGQIRLRWSLIPGASKGWDPRQFQSMAHALDFAMASKRMKFAWLAQATRIPIDKLKAAVRSHGQLTEEELTKVESYLGMPIVERLVSRVKRHSP